MGLRRWEAPVRCGWSAVRAAREERAASKVFAVGSMASYFCFGDICGLVEGDVSLGLGNRRSFWLIWRDLAGLVDFCGLYIS